MRTIDLDEICKSFRNISSPTGTRTIISADVSATNVFIHLVTSDAKGTNQTLCAEAEYNGQKITDFAYVLGHFIHKTEVSPRKIDCAILAPAGPIRPDRRTCKITNANYTLHADAISKALGFPVALINDFYAIGLAVATKGARGELNTLELKHSNNTYGVSSEHANIAVAGAGTGFGVVRLFWDNKLKLYIPRSSEGGHTSLPIRPAETMDIYLAAYLSDMLGDKSIPHIESAVSGNGIKSMCLALCQHPKYKNSPAAKSLKKQLEKIKDPAEFIATIADYDNETRKNGSTEKGICGTAMAYFWKFYGRALRNIAVHELAQGGIWIAGGIARKNMAPISAENTATSTSEQANLRSARISRILMNQFDNSMESHRELVMNIPVKLITDPCVGAYGAAQAALIDVYRADCVFYNGAKRIEGAALLKLK